MLTLTRLIRYIHKFDTSRKHLNDLSYNYNIYHLYYQYGFIEFNIYYGAHKKHICIYEDYSLTISFHMQDIYRNITIEYKNGDLYLSAHDLVTIDPINDWVRNITICNRKLIELSFDLSGLIKKIIEHFNKSRFE